MPQVSTSQPVLRRLIITVLFAVTPLTLISATENTNGSSPQAYPYAPPASHGQPQYLPPQQSVSPSGNGYPPSGQASGDNGLSVQQALGQLRQALQQNQAELTQTRQDIQWVQAMMQRLGQTLDWLQYRQQEHQQREQQLSEQLASREQNNADATANGQERISRLTRERDALRQQLARKENTLTRVRAELQRVQGLLRQSRTESADLQQQLSQTQTALASVQPAASAERKPDTATDADGDGIGDAADLCPDTRSSATVSPLGCDRNQPAVLKGVKFQYDSEAFTADSRPILQRVARLLRQHPDLRLEVAGHTDAQGNPAYNEWLSEQRARSVRQYLIDQGVAADRLVAKGYGQTQPIGDNNTLQGIQKNRRVELRLIK